MILLNSINKKEKALISLGIIINIILVLIFEPPCLWKKNFNIECAGCGGTRMLKSLLKFDFYQAFRFNPFLFSLLFLYFLYLSYVLVSKILKKNYYQVNNKDLFIMLILTILFMILRNISIFNFLKPTIVS